MIKVRKNYVRKAVASLRIVPLVAMAAPAGADGFYNLGSLGGSYITANALSADGNVAVGVSTIAGNSTNHAFRWTGGTITDLGTLSGTRSDAKAVSADGLVVAGDAYTTGNQYVHAFRWTDGTMTDLQTLGGNRSHGKAVSADGSVVVGYSETGVGYESHAFRWANGTMTNINTWAGTNSSATAVSADGGVVVGYSRTGVSYFSHAFRWTNDVMTDLETLGGTSSYAYAVSADGSVVAGNSDTGGGSSHAFRWTNDVMTDLGTLGGTYSNAAAISADGLVVVGSSNSASGQAHAFRWADGTMADIQSPTDGWGTASGVSADGSVVIGLAAINGGSEQSFRWTQETGAQSIQDWLADSGITVPSGYHFSGGEGDGLAVSADGNTLVGLGALDGQQVAWLARAGGFLSDTAAFDRSVIAAGGSAAQGGLAPANLALYGSHHRTLLDNGLAMTGNGSCAWSTVDATRNNATGADVGLAEIGFCHDVAGVRVGLGLGTTSANQTWALGGNARYHGQYILAEIDKAFPTNGNGSIEASLLAYYSYANTRLNRAYTNGAAIDISTGSPGVRTSALKARLDWKNATKLGSFSVSPYAVVTWAQSRVAAYTETGGGFPATYKAAKTNTTDLRLGAAFAGKINPKTDMRFGVELVHQFQNNTAGMNGAVTGLYSFNLPGQTLKSNWARMTLDVDYHLKANTVLTAGFNAATSGSDPTVGITIGLRASL